MQQRCIMLRRRTLLMQKWCPGGYSVLAYCQVLGKYKEFNIFFPTTGWHQRYGYKNALFSLSCYLKSQEKSNSWVIYLYSALIAKGEEMRQCFFPLPVSPRRPLGPLCTLSICLSSSTCCPQNSSSKDASVFTRQSTML